MAFLHSLMQELYISYLSSATYVFNCVIVSQKITFFQGVSLDLSLYYGSEDVY